MAELTIAIEEVRALSNLVLGVSGSATPTKAEQIITPTGEEVGFGIFECAAIPAEYIKPEGAKPTDLDNGEQDVTEYKTATRTRTTGIFYDWNLASGAGSKPISGVKKLRKMPYLADDLTSSATLYDCEQVMARAFYGCPIREITLSVCKTLDARAFEGSGVRYVYMPVVQKIGAAAFKDSALYGLTMYRVTKVPSLAADAFEGCADLGIIYVPKAMVDAFKVAPVWSNYADKIKGI